MSWDDLDREYRAKGWPTIDPRKPDYCYQPCENGLHVCGFHPDGLNFLTVANIRTPNAEAAKGLFERARLECCAEDGEPVDLIVDLQIEGECDRDFPMTRQMLERLQSLHLSPDGKVLVEEVSKESTK